MAFRNKSICWEQLLGQTIKLFFEFTQISDCSTSTPTIVENSWNPPLNNCLKLNTDESWNSCLNCRWISWILRDHLGKVIQAGHKCFRWPLSVDYLEAMVIWGSLSAISNLNTLILVESDSINTINLINDKKKSIMELDHIIEQIKIMHVVHVVRNFFFLCP